MVIVIPEPLANLPNLPNPPFKLFIFEIHKLFNGCSVYLVEVSILGMITFWAVFSSVLPVSISRS